MCGQLLTCVLAILAALLPAIAAAQRLPVQSYSTASGLGNNWINCVVADSRGFLWFCTKEGLSRIDGYGFTTYSIDDGLPGASINTLVETRDGTYWVGTRQGLGRFNPTSAGPAKFSTILPSSDPSSHDVRALFEDSHGKVWIGTLAGLFSVQGDGTGLTNHPLPGGKVEVMTLTDDRSGALWAGTSSGLYRLAQGRTEHFSADDGLPGNFISTLAPDRTGRIWLGTRQGGIARMEVDAASGAVRVVARFGTREGLPSVWVNQILERSDGTIWAATFGGVVEFQPTAEGFRLRTLGRAQGLPADSVNALAEDRHQSLWVGGELGAAKLGRLEFAIFDAASGINVSTTLVESLKGELLVMDGIGPGTRIAHLTGARFVSVQIPASKAALGWGWNQTFLIDREGDWWIGARNGVLRYRGIRSIEDLAHASPVATYNHTTGLAADVVLRIFEDSRGDIWVSTTGEGKGNGLSRWRRTTRSWDHWTNSEALPLLNFFVSAFAEDHDGNVWLGFDGFAGVARYKNGTWARFDSDDGVPRGSVRNLFVDSQGRLWIPTIGGGLAVTGVPSDERPSFTLQTVADGLSSNTVSAVVEGANGYLYAGTGRGLDRLDPATGSITAVATGEGFPLGIMQAALRSSSGALWFSFNSCVVRYIPAASASKAMPRTLLFSVDASGDRRAISAVGQPKLDTFELRAGQSVHIEFLAPGGDDVGKLRYQMKLDGGDPMWTAPAEHRSVTFANLSPGTYRFAVRAVDHDGTVGEVAGFSFTVLAPMWRRWWFLGLVVLAVAAVGHLIYRRRMARLLEIAGMRARIATDLHDDIGANLTRIAVLSEVARQQSMAAPGNRTLDRQLDSIATVARESMTAMSDIVWAISPERDSVAELVRKMREYAGEVAPDIALTFVPPDDGRGGGCLGPDARREVYLIFKEAMNNVARHAAATTANVHLRIDFNGLLLTVSDNGVGFGETPDDGNGLISMQRRAHRLGGQLQVTSATGAGTTVHLEVSAAQLRNSRARRPG
jgi:ligand-binding sensor domain-containing protein/signal transduction histidine kinase